MLSCTLVCTLAKEEDLAYLEGDLIGVDRGAAFLHRHHLPMVFACGDFDSCDKNELKDESLIIVPSEKDFTDSELALRLAKEKGYTQIKMIGALGGRQDHNYANFVLCRKYKAVLQDAHNRIEILEAGKHAISNEVRYVSFFALIPSVISIEGCKYPLDHYDLDVLNCIGISNENLGNGKIIVHQGEVMMIQSEDNPAQNETSKLKESER